MGIRGFGKTMAEAFEAAAVAMIAVSVDPETVKQKKKVEVTCEQQDDDLLLIEWLNTLLYEMAARNMIFGRFEVTIEAKQLTGRAWGEELDRERHRPVLEIKGTTYSDLKVVRKNEEWIAQCIIDI
jgi:tRNA nucleotidyltransferase (CCA-adding enzyme)